MYVLVYFSHTEGDSPFLLPTKAHALYVRDITWMNERVKCRKLVVLFVVEDLSPTLLVLHIGYQSRPPTLKAVGAEF